LIRLLADGHVELINTQSSGRLEVLTGSLVQTEMGLILQLQSMGFLNDPRMLEASRTITMEGNILHYALNMRTTAVPNHAFHMEATLNRIESV